MKNKTKGNKWIFILMIIFCLLIGWIILFKMSFSIADLDKNRGINLIPFYYKNETAFHFNEIMMNLMAFVPLGIYLKLMHFDLNKSILFGFGYSLFLEIMQLILSIGITDITDLITNTLGVIIGISIYNILTKIFKKTDTLDKVLKILATIGTILFILLISTLTIVN